MSPKSPYLNTPLLAIVAVVVTCLLCYVVLAMPQREHRLKYIGGDWQPHFGYHPGHYASDHKWRYKNANLTRPPKIKTRGSPNPTLPLDEYLVQVMYGNILKCSGIIMNTKHVLTIKTCIYILPVENLKVKLFDGKMMKVVNSSDATDLAVAEGHELLMLLELDEDLDPRYKSPPPICPRQVNPTDMVELWFWDHDYRYIQRKKVKLVNGDECKIILNDRKGQVVTNATICLKNVRYTKKCIRSYGLPYVWMDSFCGLNLLGHNCPKPIHVDLYVRLLDNKRFVADKIRLVYMSELESEIV